MANDIKKAKEDTMYELNREDLRKLLQCAARKGNELGMQNRKLTKVLVSIATDKEDKNNHVDINYIWHDLSILKRQESELLKEIKKAEQDACELRDHETFAAKRV